MHYTSLIDTIIGKHSKKGYEDNSQEHVTNHQMFNLTIKSLKIQSSEKTLLPIMAKSFEIDNTHSM